MTVVATRDRGHDGSITFVDLSGTELSGAELGGLNLSGADLTGAGAANANPAGATLNPAKLSSADLFLANLHDASLIGATLTLTSWKRISPARTSLRGPHWYGRHRDQRHPTWPHAIALGQPIAIKVLRN